MPQKLEDKEGLRFALCVSICAETVEELSNKIKIARMYSPELIELRLDCIEALDRRKLRTIANLLNGNEILTIRTKGEGGRSLAEGRRIRLVKNLCRFHPRFIDVEIRTLNKEPQLVRTIRRSGIGLIASFHDNKGNTTIEKLKQIISGAPEIPNLFALKIVRLARNFADNDKVLALYSERTRNEPKLVAFCAGEKGIRSRIRCLFLGSPWSYCSLPGEPVAPGQLDIESMRRAVQMAMRKVDQRKKREDLSHRA